MPGEASGFCALTGEESISAAARQRAIRSIVGTDASCGRDTLHVLENRKAHTLAHRRFILEQIRQAHALEHVVDLGLK